MVFYCLYGIIDIDECMEGSSGCSDQCYNEVGSFYCSCSDGYKLSSTDNKTCQGK